MELSHILTQVQNSNYRVDYSKSNFGYKYAIVCSLHKNLEVKINITDSVVYWVAEVDGSSVGSGKLLGFYKIQESLTVLQNIIDGSIEDLELILCGYV